jgi:hypothetical protein
MSDSVQPVQCPNCSAPVASKYCPNCGQAAPAEQNAGVVADFFKDILNLEHKLLGTVATLMGKPGQLSVAYLEGKRVRFVGPFQLFSLCVGLNVLAVTALPIQHTSFEWR